VPARLRVLVDVQAFQNPWSARRGIGRYLRELLGGLDQLNGGVRLSYMLNPDLPVPSDLQSRSAPGELRFSDQVAHTDADLIHVPSPFEPAPIDRVWPAAVRGLPLVVTVYDLIPFILRDLYLENPNERRWFRTRLELVQRADRVIAISDSTGKDVIEHAGVSPHRVVVTGAAPPKHFKPARDRQESLQALKRELPDVRRDFIVYQGGMDPRKNIERLVNAYAGLPAALRRRHQLVIVCELWGEQRQQVDDLLGEFDAKADVLFTGYVSDETLALLFQSARLSIFPSLYEGYGLPVAEAMASGTPVIGSRTSSIPELIHDDEALFDPYDADAIRTTLKRALEDPAFLKRLGAARLDRRHDWHEVALRTARVYADTRLEHRPARRLKPRFALALAFPGRDADATQESYRFLERLAQHSRVDVFLGVEDDAHLPPAVERQPLKQFELIERGRGGYDTVVTILDDDPNAYSALAMARAKGGHVILRNPALTRLYARLARERPDLEPRGFSGAVRSMYEDRLPAGLGNSNISPDDVTKHGLLMTSEVVSAAQRVIVHSEHASHLVQLDAALDDADKIAVLPPAYPARDASVQGPDRLVIARVGLDERATHTLIAAVATVAGERSDLEVALVVEGRRPGEQLRRLVEESDLRTGVTFALETDMPTWRALLRRASAAMELRHSPEPVVSAFVQETLAAGIPTVVSDVGPLGELPDGALVKVPPDAPAGLVATELGSLIDGQQPEIGNEAAAYAGANTAEDLADRIFELIFR
jgi:glycosyltransferase involved in cell wall biosynthesis